MLSSVYRAIERGILARAILSNRCPLFDAQSYRVFIEWLKTCEDNNAENFSPNIMQIAFANQIFSIGYFRCLPHRHRFVIEIRFFDARFPASIESCAPFSGAAAPLRFDH